MAKYIPLDALVAEIEKETKTLKQEIPSCENKEHKKGKLFGLQRALYLIDTLEVKEVDLEEEITNYFKGWGNNEIHCFAMMQDGTSVGIDECIDIAKHFFELGLNSSVPMTWEDIRNIDTLCCKVEMEHIPKEEEHYQEVLKRFKAQKGE